MQVKRISDQVLVIIFPERRIKEDFGIKEDMFWGRIPEYLVSSFFIRHYKNLREDLKDCVTEYGKNRLPNDWDKAKLGLEVRVPGLIPRKIDIVLQSQQNYYIIETKSGGQIQEAITEVIVNAEAWEEKHPDSLLVKPVVITSRRGDMTWAKIHLKPW